MKKLLAFALIFVLAFTFVACTQPGDVVDTPDTPAVMSYAEFVAAPMESAVVVETYVQATQSWWDNKITVYTQNEEGAYFLYEMACSEEDAAKLVPGTKIRVSGHKTQWSGEVEIVDATFEILEGSYIAEPIDVTALLGTEQLINEQNKLVSFKDMTIEAIEYKNGEPGDDIYVTVSKDGVPYSFCVEVYLTGTDTDVYKAVQGLVAGDVVDIECFLYWYEGVNTHITSVELSEIPALEGEGEGEEVAVSELRAMLDTVTKGATPEELMVDTIEVVDEMFPSFFFVEAPAVEYEAHVSMPLIGSIAHQVAIVKVADGADVASLAKDIETNIDPRKWICAEAEKTAVLTKDNIILVVMSAADVVDAVTANFNAL